MAKQGKLDAVIPVRMTRAQRRWLDHRRSREGRRSVGEVVRILIDDARRAERDADERGRR